MPSLVTHHLFAARVLAKLKKNGIQVNQPDAAYIGAQGPDIFFFHRALPWQLGDSLTMVGSRLHRSSPARLLECFRAALNTEATQNPNEYDTMLSYCIGFFCHYAIDRTAHPYVIWAQSLLKQQEPAYGTSSKEYHYRIESALDTILLRRETGRLMSGFFLPNALPKDKNNLYFTIGRFYQMVLLRMYGLHFTADNLALAPGDMRHTLHFLNDPSTLRQKLILRSYEKVFNKGHQATSLLRPAETDDWDYANKAHAEWRNPFDTKYSSTDSFFDLYEYAASEAADMITEFLHALPCGKSMQEITQDRGFSSDLPGVYEERAGI